MTSQHTRVRPRLSAFLRATLQGQPPQDVDQALLDRQAKYGRALEQQKQQQLGAPASSGSEGAGDGSGGSSSVSWEAVVKASTRGGRLGGALKNGSEAKDAFHQLVRLATQLAGEEGAVDSASGMLFEVAAAPNAAGRRGEYERLVQRPVKESTWLQAVGWAEALVAWYKEATAERAAALVARGGAGGARREQQELDQEQEMWGSGLRFQDGMVPTPELEGLADEEVEAEAAEEGGAGPSHACFGRDGRDDAEYGGGAAAAGAAAAAVAGFGDKADATGLLDRCEAHVALTGGLGLGPVDLAKATLDILGKQAQDEAALQARLFDLFGAEVR